MAWNDARMSQDDETFMRHQVHSAAPRIEDLGALVPYLLTAANLTALAAGLRVYFHRDDGKEYSVERDGELYNVKGLSAKEAKRMFEVLGQVGGRAEMETRSLKNPSLKGLSADQAEVVFRVLGQDGGRVEVEKPATPESGEPKENPWLRGQ